MSSLKKPINFEALEDELNDALEADELYKLQNDAKIRAIEQRVPTYDNFCDMVKAAHLRPLERSEMQKKPDVSWNHCYVKKDESSYLRSDNLNTDLEKTHKSVLSDSQPGTSTEFLRIWKDLNNSAEKFQYLLRLRERLKNKFFKAEVPSDFLEELIVVLLEICTVDLIPSIVDILQIISKCNRFSLTMAMISLQAKTNVKVLFEKLITLKTEDVEEVKNLMISYHANL